VQDCEERLHEIRFRVVPRKAFHQRVTGRDGARHADPRREVLAKIKAGGGRVLSKL
jgi:hypothetical protein